MQDFNDNNSFYLTNYLFSHFDYSSLSASPSNHHQSASIGCVSNVSVSTTSSSSSPTTAATASAVSITYKSNNYLTRILRNYSNIDTQYNVPLYGTRDLHSVVNYHKEMGVAPILSFFKK